VRLTHCAGASAAAKTEKNQEEEKNYNQKKDRNTNSLCTANAVRGRAPSANFTFNLSDSASSPKKG
jgi:hypothetical protein